MKKNLNKAYVLTHKGCYDRKQTLELSFMQKGEFTLLDVVNSEIPLKDKYWFVINKGRLTLPQKREIAIGVASIVLVIYETKYPNDKRPREAIQAARDYLAGIIGIDELRLRRNAAAYAAADAYAAYAAAYAAADAAYAAADAYAYAAYAAAADAAAYAAADAAGRNYKDALLQFLIDYITNNE